MKANKVENRVADKKKLIEVALPIEAINIAIPREITIIMIKQMKECLHVN